MMTQLLVRFFVMFTRLMKYCRDYVFHKYNMSELKEKQENFCCFFLCLHIKHKLLILYNMYYLSISCYTSGGFVLALKTIHNIYTAFVFFSTGVYAISPPAIHA